MKKWLENFKYKQWSTIIQNTTNIVVATVAIWGLYFAYQQVDEWKQQKKMEYLTETVVPYHNKLLRLFTLNAVTQEKANFGTLTQTQAAKKYKKINEDIWELCNQYFLNTFDVQLYGDHEFARTIGEPIILAAYYVNKISPKSNSYDIRGANFLNKKIKDPKLDLRYREIDKFIRNRDFHNLRILFFNALNKSRFYMIKEIR